MQGRALLNAVGNLELKDEYSEALHKLGHDLEAVAEQVQSFLVYCILSLIFLSCSRNYVLSLSTS